jgi:hypothetical protein
MSVRRGVINIVEVLVLILIFLGAAALFATFMMSSTSQQAQTLKEEQRNVAIAFNPPVTVVGVVTISANITGDPTLNPDGKNGTVPIVCVQETAGGRWWLAQVQLQAGTAGSLLRVHSPGQIEHDLLTNPQINGNISYIYQLGNVTFVPLNHQNNTIAICYDATSGSPIWVHSLYITCDQQEALKAIKWFVANCTQATSGNYTIKIYNLVEYVPPGAVVPVVAPLIRPEYGWNYTSYSVKVYFGVEIRPNPLDIPHLIESGQGVTWDRVYNVLKQSGNKTSVLDTFMAQCESCSFYVG